MHTAQGVTADTMHGLVTGEESRQQLYTMLTRGRIANHLYLQVVGDGDPHSLIRPETVHPSTATELLEQILARDGAARSATTLQRDQHDPAVRLADAAAHYVDALQVAAEDLAGREVVEALDVAAEQIVPGLTDEPAWPTLRAHLLLLAAHGTDPVAQLAAAAGAGNSTPPTTGPPSWIGGSTTPATATPARDRCRGSPASRKGCATTRCGATTWPPDPTWSARWPTRLGAAVADTDPPDGLPSAAPCCRAASSGKCRCGGPRCRSARRTGVPPAPCSSEGRPDLAAAPRPSGGRRPVTGPAGMGLAARPAQPQPDPGSVRPNARGPAGGALPRRRRRAAAALFGHHHRWAAAR